MSDILEGIWSLSNFTELVIGSHEIGEKTVEMFSKVFDKRKLQTLKIIDCQVNPVIAENLLKTFEAKSRVKNLAFVKFPFTDKAFASFCRFFSEDLCLESLDLSYTKGIKPMSFLPFFEALS